MSITDADIAFAKDLFSALPGVTSRKMFGGLSLYSEGTIFAIVSSDNRIYIKAYDELADALAGLGGEKFTHAKKDGSVATMGYWTLPDSAQDDPDEAADWARKSLIQNG